MAEIGIVYEALNSNMVEVSRELALAMGHRLLELAGTEEPTDERFFGVAFPTQRVEWRDAGLEAECLWEFRSAGHEPSTLTVTEPADSEGAHPVTSFILVPDKWTALRGRKGHPDRATAHLVVVRTEFDPDLDQRTPDERLAAEIIAGRTRPTHRDVTALDQRIMSYWGYIPRQRPGEPRPRPS
jgi:hypothetical protein